MELVIAGKLNKQIAADLGTSEKTIKVHRAG
jgi:FixJ family two-component response regulator